MDAFLCYTGGIFFVSLKKACCNFRKFYGGDKPRNNEAGRNFNCKF